METPIAYVFNGSAHTSDDDLYPFLEGEQLGAATGSTADDHSDLFMGVYPAAMADFDFAATVQALPSHEHSETSPALAYGMGQENVQQQQHHSHGSDHDSGMLSPSTFNDLTLTHQQEKTNMNKQLDQLFDASSSTSAALPVRSPQKPQLQRQRQAARQRKSPPPAPSSTRSDSPTCSPPTSVNGDGNGSVMGSMRDSEDILNAPVKSLTEEEKKLRRRAQVAKSARKHRNRQKEELARLREQVQQLQEQMAAMTHRSGAESPTTIKREQDVITQHRKRKKVDDLEDGSSCDTLSINQGHGFISAPVAPQQTTQIQHWYHHLPVDTLERSTLLSRIADKRMEVSEQYVRNEFGGDVFYPLTDLKLSSNGPDLEIKQMRGKLVTGFNHIEVGQACWDSFSNFRFDVPERFQKHVTCERLMELDDNTRYGRTIVPLLRDQHGRMVYFHSYFIVRRHVRDDFVMLTWETIAADDLYPTPEDENPETALRNDEVGCMIMETEQLANAGVRTIFRSITHSTPPVGAMTHPRSKVNEAFLTVFCRNAEAVEASAYNLLVKTYPERIPKPQVVV